MRLSVDGTRLILPVPIALSMPMAEHGLRPLGTGRRPCGQPKGPGAGSVGGVRRLPASARHVPSAVGILPVAR